MILAETSVLIDYLRTHDAKLGALLHSLPVAICGAVRAEILCGARSAAHRQKLFLFLASFHYVAMSKVVWDKVGDNLASLRTKGITVPFPDVVIATIAIEIDAELWARDPHYVVIQTVLPALKLFQEPP